jgi:hypothetical protein
MPSKIKDKKGVRPLQGVRIVSSSGIIRDDVKRFIDLIIFEGKTVREAYVLTYDSVGFKNDPYTFYYQVRQHDAVLLYIDECKKVVRANAEYAMDAIEDMRNMLAVLKEAGDYAEYTKLMKVYTTALKEHALAVRGKIEERKDITDIEL